MGISPLTGQDPGNFSYVNIEYSGKISVLISSSDNRKYRNKLSFSDLCGSTGDLFKRFLSYYTGNRESMIISEMNANHD